MAGWKTSAKSGCPNARAVTAKRMYLARAEASKIRRVEVHGALVALFITISSIINIKDARILDAPGWPERRGKIPGSGVQ